MSHRLIVWLSRQTWLVLIAATALAPQTGYATYSMIACDSVTGACGVVVATNNLAVGASVCYAEAGVGAVVSQFETNPAYGPEGLRLMAEGQGVEQVLAHLLANDNNFEGMDTSYRQVALVHIKGPSIVHTGQEVLASGWAGSRNDVFYAIQGNGLAGEHVILAMEQTFLNTTGALAERLMAALQAGHDAGGQSTGVMSAALLVRTVEGWPFDIDLRVDASDAPVESLRRLLDLHYARQAIIRAERFARQGHTDRVWTAVSEALQRGHDWDRIWRRAARLAMSLEEPEKALTYLGVFYALNPTWARVEMQQPRYASLHSNALYQQWMKGD